MKTMFRKFSIVTVIIIVIIASLTSVAEESKPENDKELAVFEIKNDYKFIIHKGIFSYITLKEERYTDVTGKPIVTTEKQEPKDVIFYSIFPNGYLISVAVAFSPFAASSAKFDFSECPKSEFLLIGAQHDKSDVKTLTNTIGIYRNLWDVLFMDGKFILYPQKIAQLKQDAPLINVKFYRDGKAEEPILTKELLIQVKSKSQKNYDTAIARDGSLLIKHVYSEPLELILIHKVSKKRWEYTLFPAFRSSVPSVVLYSVGDVFRPVAPK